MFTHYFLMIYKSSVSIVIDAFSQIFLKPILLGKIIYKKTDTKCIYYKQNSGKHHKNPQKIDWTGQKKEWILLEIKTYVNFLLRD